MTEISVKIFDSLEDAPVIHGKRTYIQPLQCHIIKNGTINGRAGLEFILSDDDSNFFVCTFTAGVFDMIHSILTGAEAQDD